MNQMSCVWDASASWGEQRLLDGTLLLHDRGPPGPRAEPRWSPDEQNQGPEVPRSWLSRGRYETRAWPVCLFSLSFSRPQVSGDNHNGPCPLEHRACARR